MLCAPSRSTNHTSEESLAYSISAIVQRSSFPRCFPDLNIVFIKIKAFILLQLHILQVPQGRVSISPVGWPLSFPQGRVSISPVGWPLSFPRGRLSISPGLPLSFAQPAIAEYFPDLCDLADLSESLYLGRLGR